MVYIIFNFVVCLLAVYGLFTILRSLKLALYRNNTVRLSGVRVVVLVKDTEKYIEYIIRNINHMDLKSVALSDRNIAVVDMNSSDSTFMLLEKLKKDFQNLDIYKYDERSGIFEGF